MSALGLLAAVGLVLGGSSAGPDLESLFQADQQTVRLDPKERAEPLVERLTHRDQRVALFEWMAARLQASDDELIKAAIILQHSNFDTESDSGGSAWSQDNHLYAFFLARRAWLMGHKDGAWLMAATVARWLRLHQLPPELGLATRANRAIPVLRDPELSDAERLAAGLPLRLEQLIRRPSSKP